MNKEKITRTCPCAFRAGESDGKKYIEGYFAVFGDVYDMGWGITESIHRNAFDKYLNGDIRILVNHDSTLVLGRTKAGTATATADDHGIYVRCEVNEDDTDALNLYARTKRGDVTNASFGGFIVAEERVKDAKTGNVHYTLMEVDVFEFSVCTFPAYEATDVGARSRENPRENPALTHKRWKENLKERFEKWH